MTYVRCKHLMKDCPTGGFNTQDRLIEWCGLMGGFLEELCIMCGKASSTELLGWAIASGFTPTCASYQVPIVRQALYRHLSIALVVDSPDHFNINPPNSPVCLLQWEILFKMLQGLQLQGCLRQVSKKMWVWGMRPYFIDAHAHVQRTMQRFGKTTFQECEVKCEEHTGEILAAVIANCVFPDERAKWQHLSEDPRIWFSFGCHPGTGEDPVQAGIKELCGHHRCVGVGECGLDQTYNIPLSRQIDVLQGHLSIALHLEKPIILHLRGKDKDSSEVYFTALEVLSRYLPRAFKIYLHAFGGDSEVSRVFLQAFPNTLFGISGLWWRTRKLANGITSIPLNKLAIETDSPYLPAPGNKIQSPWRVCRVAGVIGRRRNLPAAVVMEIARDNCAEFFGIH